MASETQYCTYTHQDDLGSTYAAWGNATSMDGSEDSVGASATLNDVDVPNDDGADEINANVGDFTLSGMTSITSVQVAIRMLRTTTLSFATVAYGITTSGGSCPTSHSMSPSTSWAWDTETCSHHGTWTNAKLDSATFQVRITNFSTSIGFGSARLDSARIICNFATGYANDIAGIAAADIAEVSGVAAGDIVEVQGVS
jgi:hypothetical protein